MFHLFLHVAVPVLVGWLCCRPHWKKPALILAAGYLLDVDHLLATPMFDPNRCSLNFHPLHTYWAIGAYGLLLLPARTRVWAIGFLLHMALDYLECLPLGVYAP